MKKTNKLLIALSMAFVLSMCAFVTLATPKQVKADDSYWSLTPQTWTINDDGTLVNNNFGGFTANYLLTDDANLVGDYAIEAEFTGSAASTFDAEINMGIVPYYIDSNNWSLVYLKWNPNNRKMICVQTFWKENGVQKAVGGGSWHDHWLDHAYANTLHLLEPTDTIKVRVEKKLNSAGADDYVVIVSAVKNGVTINETPVTDCQWTVSVPYAAKRMQAGVYSNNDTVTVKNFKVESLTEAGVYKNVDANTVARAGMANAWAVSEGTYTVDATNGNSLANQAIIDNAFTESNYRIEYTGTATGDAENKELSILPWYQDEHNFVRFVLTQSGTLTAEGMKAGVAFTGESVTLTGIDMASVQLAAERVGSKFVCYVNGDIVASYEDASILNGARVGIGAGNASATMANVTISEVVYNAYDWFTLSGYYVSAQTKLSVEFGEEAIVLNSAAGEEKYTRIYKETGKINSVGVRASFVADSSDASYGLYVYYEDENNNVYVIVESDLVTLFIVENGSVSSICEFVDLTLTDANVLDVYAEFSSVIIKVNGEVVMEEEVEMLADLVSSNAGILAIGGVVTVSDYSVYGFTRFSARELGDYTVYGAYLDSWKLGENGELSVKADGTTFKNSLAITDCEFAPAQGYYVGAKINITGLESVEWKTGFCPWYLDSQNNIFVWLAQWNGGATTITVTGRIGGAVIGNEWRESQVAFNQPGENYLEVYINGDSLHVYVNRSFAASFSTSYEGLSAQEGKYIALNNFNTHVTYSEVTVSSTRIFTVVGDPVIEIIGSFPATAEVGATLKLPIISATGIGGDTAVVAISVTDPNGASVELDEKNNFTASVAGTYVVSYTATDVWGNTKTESKEIVITEAEEDSSSVEPGDVEEPTKSCKSSLGFTTPVLSLLACAVAVVIKRRKND